MIDDMFAIYDGMIGRKGRKATMAGMRWNENGRPRYSRSVLISSCGAC